MVLFVPRSGGAGRGYQKKRGDRAGTLHLVCRGEGEDDQ
jgi:hypothetical protein